jgi:hypothetical protein
MRLYWILHWCCRLLVFPYDTYWLFVPLRRRAQPGMVCGEVAMWSQPLHRHLRRSQAQPFALAPWRPNRLKGSLFIVRPRLDSRLIYNYCTLHHTVWRAYCVQYYLGDASGVGQLGVLAVLFSVIVCVCVTDLGHTYRVCYIAGCGLVQSAPVRGLACFGS